MTTLTAPAQLAFKPAKPNAKGFDLGLATRGFIGIAATAMTIVCLVALARGLTGIAPSYLDSRHIAVIIHVSAVLPCVPLGAWLFLTRKGGTTHKRLGKLWVALMVVTAASAIFINSENGFGFLHIFVPITLFSAWRTVATARAGQIQKHKNHLIGMYLGALMIPGVFAFAISGRLMNAWLLL